MSDKPDKQEPTIHDFGVARFGLGAKALCPHCGQHRTLLAILPGDKIQERRLDPHADPASFAAGEVPIEGTCPGSNLIESGTGEARRQEVLAAREARARA